MDGLMQKLGGAEVLRKAVSGMLPKNRLRDDRLARLKAFEGDAHPYKANLVRFNGKPSFAARQAQDILSGEAKVKVDTTT